MGERVPPVPGTCIVRRYCFSDTRTARHGGRRRRVGALGAVSRGFAAPHASSTPRRCPVSRPHRRQPTHQGCAREAVPRVLTDPCALGGTGATGGTRRRAAQVRPRAPDGGGG